MRSKLIHDHTTSHSIMITLQFDRIIFKTFSLPALPYTA